MSASSFEVTYHICELVLELVDKILYLCLSVLFRDDFLQSVVLTLNPLLAGSNVSHALDDSVIHRQHHLGYDLSCFVLKTKHLILIH